MVDITPLFRAYAARRLAALAAADPVREQRRELRRLVRRAAHTRFGRRHHFSSVKTVEDYQRAVPLRDYDTFWREWWQAPFPILDNCTWPGRVPFFALSSGTSTGVTKHVPCTAAVIRANARAALGVLAFHLHNRPASRILGGKQLMLGGSTALNAFAPGIYAGDLSGIAARTAPAWVRPWYYPDVRVSLMSDWEEKIRVLAADAPKRDVRLLSGVPSWMLLFLDELCRTHGGESGLSRILPNLEVVVHGGVSFAPYRQRFEGLLAGTHAELREVYPASEGFLAAADAGVEDGLRLFTGNGLFFEFVPLAELGSATPTRHWLATAQPGINYAVVLTTCAGLWSYVLGDTVSFVSLRPPRIMVTGRTTQMLSAFGEHVIVGETEAAVAAVSAGVGVAVNDYAVGPVFAEKAGRPGRHRWVIECSAGITPEQRKRLAAGLDRELRRRNADYAAHRSGEFGMAGPEILTAPAGAFAAWMKARGRFGGQNKVPRIVTDSVLFENLCAFVAASRAGEPGAGEESG
jgi:hypothetical protein